MLLPSWFLRIYTPNDAPFAAPNITFANVSSGPYDPASYGNPASRQAFPCNYVSRIRQPSCCNAAYAAFVPFRQLFYHNLFKSNWTCILLQNTITLRSYLSAMARRASYRGSNLHSSTLRSIIGDPHFTLSHPLLCWPNVAVFPPFTCSAYAS
jgi:hypothetical protein